MLERAAELLQERFLCDNCLGRQFGQLGSGLTNAERGRALRVALLLSYELEPFPIDGRNLAGFALRKQKAPAAAKKPLTCDLCKGLFHELDRIAAAAAKLLAGWEYTTFAVGTLPGKLAAAEEAVWEESGIEHVEPLRSELNRELGKRLGARIGKEVDERNPEVLVLAHADTRKLELQVAPLYVAGEYQKLVRGIPQTKWERYKVTVEDIIAKPFMRASKGSAHALHGAGREDIDARCLAWRPFVLEIAAPRRRALDLRALERAVNKSRKVKVRGLRWSGKQEVRATKALKLDKTYRMRVTFAKPVSSLAPLRQLIGIIRQQTPQRVLHRRANLLRKRAVRSIGWEQLSARTAVLVVRGESGLYVKELVSGDGGRTKPNASEVLGVPAKVTALDVIRIHRGRGSQGS